MLKNIIVEGHRTQAQKINFFVEFYECLTKHCGQYSIWEIDNLGAILDKIIYQLDYNFDKSANYLDSYLAKMQQLANDFPSFAKKFVHLHKVNILYREYLQLPKKKRNANIFCNNNKPKLLALQKEIATNELSVAIELLAQFLQCECVLQEHKNELVFLARTIYSILYFSNKTKEKAITLMQILFDKGSYLNKLEKNQGFTVALQKQKNVAENDKVDGRGGFYYQLRQIGQINEFEEKEVFCLFMIKNLVLNSSENALIFENIAIRNPRDPLFRDIRGSGNLHMAEWNEVIADENCTIAVVKDLEYNRSNGYSAAKSFLQKVISYTNRVLGTTAYIVPNVLFWTSDFKNLSYRRAPNSQNLLENDQLSKDFFPYDLLSKMHSTAAAKKFLYLEKYYQKAVATEELADYWQYLECLFANQNAIGTKTIQSQIASLLLYDYKIAYPNVLTDIIFNLLHSSNYEKTPDSLSHKEIRALTTKGTNTDIIKIALPYGKKHVIIDELIKLFKQRNSVTAKAKELEYYHQLMKEFFETRNFEVHSGVTNTHAQRKLKEVVPSIVLKVRALVIRELQLFATSTFDKVLARLLKKAQVYSKR